MITDEQIDLVKKIIQDIDDEVSELNSAPLEERKVQTALALAIHAQALRSALQTISYQKERIKVYAQVILDYKDVLNEIKESIDKARR